MGLGTQLGTIVTTFVQEILDVVFGFLADFFGALGLAFNLDDSTS